MKRAILLPLSLSALVLTAPFFAAVRAEAAAAPGAAPGDAPNVGAPDVRVMLRPQGADEPRRIVIGPRAAGVCISQPDCPDHFTIMWVGSRNEGEKIRIVFVSEGAGDCFDNIDFTIDDTGMAYRQTVKVRNTWLCRKRGKTSFFYEVSCVDAEGGDCDGVEPVDPGGMVDGPSG